MTFNIDLSKFNESELIDLNRKIVERLRDIHQAKTYKALANFNLGDRVWFNGPDVTLTVR